MSRNFGIRELDPDVLYSGMEISESPNPLPESGASSAPRSLPNPQAPAPTLSDLAAMLTRMQITLDEQQRTIQDQQRTILDLRSAGLGTSATSTRFAGNVSATAPAPTTPTAAPLVPMISSAKPKGNKPQEYSGRRESTKQFLDQCELYFRINPMTEDDKVSIAATYLRGSAFTWFGTYESNFGRIPTFAAFRSALTSAFGETDRVDKAKAALGKLRQTKSCAAYNSEFNRLIADAGYSIADQAILMDVYQQGLKMDVRNLMLSLPIRDNLEALMTDAMNCDNRIYQLAQQKRGNAGLLLPRGLPQSPASTSNAVPMEIDSITSTIHTPQGRLTPAEKERRRRENLCVFDGKSDCPGRDNIELCPNLLKKNAKLQRRTPATKK